MGGFEKKPLTTEEVKSSDVLYSFDRDYLISDISIYTAKTGKNEGKKVVSLKYVNFNKVDGVTILLTDAQSMSIFDGHLDEKSPTLPKGLTLHSQTAQTLRIA